MVLIAKNKLSILRGKSPLRFCDYFCAKELRKSSHAQRMCIDANVDETSMRLVFFWMAADKLLDFADRTRIIMLFRVFIFLDLLHQTFGKKHNT